MHIKKWKKFMAVSCNHGHLADAKDCREVLRFKENFKPDLAIHLGDCIDFAALRSGAKGGSDEFADIKKDYDAGVEFLELYKPDEFFVGNHEDRLFKLRNHKNAMINFLANSVLNDIKDLLKKLNSKMYPYNQYGGIIKHGDTKFMHGFWFNEAAIRDHAETFGKCVIGHLHRVGQEPARRDDNAVGYCVGALAHIPSMEYAKTKRSTQRWSSGFAWGEYNNKECIVRLERPSKSGVWRLPL